MSGVTQMLVVAGGQGNGREVLGVDGCVPGDREQTCSPPIVGAQIRVDPSLVVLAEHGHPVDDLPRPVVTAEVHEDGHELEDVAVAVDHRMTELLPDRDRAAGRLHHVSTSTSNRLHVSFPFSRDSCHRGSLASLVVLALAALSASYVSPPPGWSRSDASGLGPFVSHERFTGPDGSVVEWSSRQHRKQAGPLDVGRGSTWWAPTAVGWWMGVLFAIGAVCFTVGAMPGYLGWVGADADAVTFFVGSLFFTVAAYLQYLQTLNAPTRAPARHRRTAAVLDLGAVARRLVGERGAARGHGLLQRDDPGRPRHQPECHPGTPSRVGARCRRIDVLPDRQRPGVVRGEPRMVVMARPQHLVAHRRAEPRRIDRLRGLGRRLEGGNDDRRAAQHHAREPGNRGRGRLFLVGAVLLLPERTQAERAPTP